MSDAPALIAVHYDSKVTFADSAATASNRSEDDIPIDGPQDLAVGNVSGIGRGKHTTRNITLLPVAKGLLADTPGFNQPALEGVLPENLMAYFPEIQDSISE